LFLEDFKIELTGAAVELPALFEEEEEIKSSLHVICIAEEAEEN